MVEKDAEDFWHRYKAMKAHLALRYYPWIQANLPYFTDHGEHHIESVIEAAGSLLSLQLNTKKSLLTSLDLFILLSGILWHDVSLVYSRLGHEDITRISENIKELGFPDVTVYRIVSEISRAHTGENGLDIASEREDCSVRKNYTVRPRALAAVVRFADEISENRSRISPNILPRVPEEKKIFWEYANCVSASRGDPARGFVRVSIELQEAQLQSAFRCSEFSSRTRNGTLALIEYIVCRLEKMNNERAYCASEFRDYAPIRQIIGHFTLLRGSERLKDRDLETIIGDLGLQPGGYPKISIFDTFFKTNPQWSPSTATEALA